MEEREVKCRDDETEKGTRIKKIKLTVHNDLKKTRNLGMTTELLALISQTQTM